MAPVEKRLTMLMAGSTSPIGNGVAADLFSFFDVKQTAQSHQLLVLLIDALGEALIGAVIIATHRMLEVAHGFMMPDMIFPAMAPSIFAADAEIVFQHRDIAESLFMAVESFSGDHIKADALHLAGRAGEIIFDEARG